MLQSTWMDLVLGVDIHIMLVPTPAGPVPTPLPHPFTGLVLDPMGAAMNAAMGGGIVLVNGLFVTNCGTGVMNIPPHLPVPGPFAKGKPDNDAELWFGALNVEIGGSLAVRLGEIALSCSDPVRMPTSVVLAIPKGPLVLVPRPPVPDLMTIAQSLGFKALGAALKKAGKLLRKFQRGAGAKFFKKVAKRARKSKPKSRVAQLWNKAVCFLTGHPVDVATGRLITGQVDLELTGALPLRFERNYDTASSGRESPLGRGWSHSYDEAVWVERGAVVYRNEDGREVEFSTLGLPDRVLSPGNSVYEPCERLTLEALSGARFVIRNSAGVARHFEPIATGAATGAPGTHRRPARLVKIFTRLGVEKRLAYDEAGRLTSVTDAAGRVLGFEYNLERITRVSVRGSDGSQHLVGEYEYDAAGDLVTARDGLGHAYRYEYVGHLLVKETDRNGLSFYFQYDGIDASAKCIRTWGDGGIYDHVITYDSVKRITLVENSLGENTLYQMDEAGQVVSVTDPAGRVTKYEYDDDSGQTSKVVDPGGAEAIRQYDERGNLVRVVAADGAAISLEYNSLDVPERVVDAMGHTWRSSFSLEGQPLAHVDPLGGHAQFHWQGPRLLAVIDPAGQETRFDYDVAGNLIGMLTPDGAESHWEYDGLGRCIAAVDPNGNRQTRRRDALGRLVLRIEPDGSEHSIEYDAQSNVVRARDRQRDVRFEYRSLARIAAREENGTRVEFEYDTEDRVVGLKNEHGLIYRFVLGPAGDLLEEHGFAGLRRRYIRDKAGRVSEVRRPKNRTTKYAYDAVGRITLVAYDDGTRESYAYRPDGELALADNEQCHLELERDALGRVIEERHNNDWVRVEYDALGLRKRCSSSKGFEQTIRRNAMGDVIAIEAGTHSLAPLGGAEARGAPPLSQGPFRVSFERDRLGYELERRLPGGVRARWSRDSVGRPITHEITVVGASHSLRQYKWEPNDRLKSVIDSLRGPIQYGHDPFGNVASATYADGHVDLRLPDEVGNLFKSPNKTDRKYGPAGELLESTDARGVTRFRYDPEGYLVEKIEPGERVWKYHWNGSGMLARVERPDAAVVEFAYDPLGRRLSKTHRGKTTRWLWDGNAPLHEWVELTQEAIDRDGPTLQNSYEREIAAAKRQALLARRSAQGPPVGSRLGPFRNDADAHLNAVDEPLLEGTLQNPITWVFEPESFAPLAKLVADERYSIITDHLGTPRAMFDIAGESVWSCDIDVYGGLRELRGSRRACPFRWPGQYEDVETGLYYNRFRYYDPAAGEYVSQDPIGLRGGIRLYGYPGDPLCFADPFGLAKCGAPARPVTTWADFKRSVATDIHFKNQSDAAAGWRVYKQSSTSTDPLVLGRLQDTAIGGRRMGMTRLNDPNWSPQVNDAWVQGGIDAKKPFYLGSEPGPANFFNPPGSAHPTTVFYREMQQLQNAGYRRVGDFMVPP